MMRCQSGEKDFTLRRQKHLFMIEVPIYYMILRMPIFIKCLKCSAPHLLQPQLVEMNLQRVGQRNRDQTITEKGDYEKLVKEKNVVTAVKRKARGEKRHRE